MSELFLELFSEEIPARMQKRAEEDLLKLMREKLSARGLQFQKATTFSAPRRLGLSIEDLPAKAADVSEEKKGPRVGAPGAAVQGFLKSAGLRAISEAQIVNDKKGDFYVAKIERAGAATPDILREIVPEIVRAFPWPKSMRSGSSDLQWVRPLHNICCTFDAKEVKIDAASVPSEAATWGHRFHAPAKIAVTTFARWSSDLRAAKVVPFREERKSYILKAAQEACAARGFELVDDAGLLEEVAGLAEWPQVIFGDMDAAFLDLPAEVIRLSMRTHQKYFAVRDAKTKKLAPHFIAVANIEAKDGGKVIAAGNRRVLSARLNDARFFWETDRKTELFTEARKAKLEKIVFHQKLGSVWDKVERVKALAVELCVVTGADAALVARAAELSKMDLVTETVQEFPELQGQIGRELYLAQTASSSMDEAPRSGGGGARGGDGAAASKGSSSAASVSPPQSVAGAPDSSPIEGEQSVAIAIEDHYRPLGPNDRVPTDKVAVTLALADKLDTLVGFWAIDEKPTGSSDAYGLRRAALGFVRILQTADVRVGLYKAAVYALNSLIASRFEQPELAVLLKSYDAVQLQGVGVARLRLNFEWAREAATKQKTPIFEWVADSEVTETIASDILAFFVDRLKVQLRDQGNRHDLVEAALWEGLQFDDDLVRIVARVDALDAFLKTEDGKNLLAGYKRAANILAAEEKKGRGLSDADVAAGLDAALLKEPAEKALDAALLGAIPKAQAAVEKEDFAAAMGALSKLRGPVDAFFEGVLVNAEDAALRRNKLLLLSRLREALSAVADFSKIEG